MFIFVLALVTFAVRKHVNVVLLSVLLSAM
jgi:hypothetical protein